MPWAFNRCYGASREKFLPRGTIFRRGGLLRLDLALHEDRAVRNDLLAGAQARQEADLAVRLGADLDAPGTEDVALARDDDD